MAIKIIGTTVVNDSRQLQNIASLDATTSATISSAVGGGGGGLDSAAVSNLVDSDYVRLHQVGALIDSDVPTSVKAGDLWYDKSDGTLNVYYQDSAETPVFVTVASSTAAAGDLTVQDEGSSLSTAATTLLT